MKKEQIIKKYIQEKINYCYQEDLLSLDDKEKLIQISEGLLTKDTDDFLSLIADELFAIKTYFDFSYVFSYKQAQSLIFCCKYLGLHIDVNICMNYSEIGQIGDNVSEEYIFNILDTIPLEYIEIIPHKERKNKNENYKKKTRASV